MGLRLPPGPPGSGGPRDGAARGASRATSSRIHDAIRRLRPTADTVLLLEPYGYGLGAKLRYFARTVRGTYHVRTAGLVVVDNAYLPVHVAPHRRRTTVVQVWHATGALKRFGMDTVPPPAEPERTFLHRHYDYVVTSGDASREPWSRPCGRRSSAFSRWGRRGPTPSSTPPPWRPRAPGCWRRTRASRGGGWCSGRPRSAAAGATGPEPWDSTANGCVPCSRPMTWVLAIKTHPNVDPAVQPTAGFDVVGRPNENLNDWLAAADVLLTDYSSSIFEWALLRRPLVLLVDDLEAYARDPGLYLDYDTDMIGMQVRDTDAAAAAIVQGAVSETAWDAFIARNMGACDGRASERFVDRFLPAPVGARDR